MVPKSYGPQGCSTLTEQLVHPQVELGVGTGFEGFQHPQPLGTAHIKGWWHWEWEEGFFSHLLELWLLGAAWLLSGAVEHIKQRGECFRPSTTPGR